MRARTTSTLIGLACAAAIGLPARAQGPAVRTIAEAKRLEGTRETVTIGGRASVASGALQARVFDIAVEDATAGIRVYSRTPLARVAAGDSVIVTGTLKRYRGDLELLAATMRLVPGARRVVPPHDLPIDASMIGRYPGQLVRVRGRMTRSGYSEGGQWLRIRGVAAGHADSLTLWVPANHAAPISFAAVQPGDSLVATGIVTAYQDNADDPVVWQIVPRNTEDIVLADHTRTLPAWLGWAALLTVAGVGAAIAIGRFAARRQLGALRETEVRYRQLLAMSPDAVIVHARGRIRFANPAAAQLLGVVNDAALVGRALEDFVHPESRQVLHTAADEATPRPEDAPRVRARLLVAHGGAVDVEVTASPCVYHDQPAVVLLARDIGAQLRYERDLHALALVDELTGLQNRRGFTLFAEQELARARRYGRTPVLVFADLDGLKHINDTYGHAAGDAALRLAARALKSILRETDIVARWSGDEFVALLGEGGEMAASSIGERLDAALAALAPEEQPFTVTATVGRSVLNPDLPLAGAMADADAELYVQKRRGGRGHEHDDALPVDVAG